jgi:uncharacterized protein YbjT (DUF2867 family)
MSEFLVVGGNGHVGKEVVAQLLDAGHSVRALVRSEAKVPALKRDGVTLFVGDIADADSLAPAMRGIEGAYVATGDGEESVAAFETFLKAGLEHKLQHIVRLSARSADANSPSDLTRRHGLREKALEESEIGWTHLRPTWFMQMMTEYAPGGVIAVPGGQGRIPWIDTRDIAAVAVTSLIDGGDHLGQTYELTGGRPLTYGDLAKDMSAATGRTFEYRDMSPEDFAAKMREEGNEEWYISLILQLYESIRSNTKAELALGVQEALNRQPITFAQFCRDHADELVKQL